MVKHGGFTAMAAIAAAAPAVGGQSAVQFGPPDAVSGMPPSAATGKPAITMPPTTAGETDADRCLPALPCGTRLLGTVRRNGAVELQVPALRW